MFEHAVMVRFNYGIKTLAPLRFLEESLDEAIRNAGVGEFDGNDIDDDLGHGYLYMFGPDADALFSVARPVLEAAAFMDGAVARLRYGPSRADVSERDVTIRAVAAPYLCHAEAT